MTMNKLYIPKTLLNFNTLKNFKEKVSSLMPKFIEFSGNSIQHVHNNEKQRSNQDFVYICKLYLAKDKGRIPSYFAVLYILFFMKYVSMHESPFLKIKRRRKSKKVFKGIKDLLAQIKYVFKYNKEIIELKTENTTHCFLVRKLAKSFKTDVETNTIIINPQYKFQFPGNPYVIYRLRKKLKKRLLVQRLRSKYKAIMLQQNLSLHTFMGTKEVSYASLVKNNKLNLIKFLYQYKIRTSTGKNTNFKEKQFIRRPFRVARMNQARFDIMDISDYALWFKKMENQLVSASLQPTIF